MKTDLSKFKKLYTQNEARTKFNLNYQIYVYFKPHWIEDEDYIYNRFVKSLSFEDNIKALKNKYKNKQGYFRFYIDGTKYQLPKSIKPLFTQLSLFS